MKSKQAKLLQLKGKKVKGETTRVKENGQSNCRGQSHRCG